MFRVATSDAEAVKLSKAPLRVWPALHRASLAPIFSITSGEGHTFLQVNFLRWPLGFCSTFWGVWLLPL